MRRWAIACVAALTVAASASAQVRPTIEPDPVVENYRAYDAALGRGDLAAAETAAAAALAASEARDGDEESTARLAANLAQVRLDQGKLSEALAPAQRALAIVEQRGEASGVDPIYARLLVGRAELGQLGDIGQQRLLTTLTDARANRGPRIEAYDAAIALGEWALAQSRPDAARDAFQLAGEFAEGATEADVMARAQARLGYGVALALLDRPTLRGASGTRLARAPDLLVERALGEALRMAQPVAERDARRGPVTRAQATYSSALAWLHARAAFVQALGWQASAPPSRGMVVSLGGAGACPAPATGGDTDGVTAVLARARTGADGSIVGATLIGPAERLEHADYGYATSAVARITTDSSGAITDARVLGAVDALSLERALSDILTADFAAAPAGCGGARVIFAPVVILLDGAALRNNSIRTGLLVGGARQNAIVSPD